MAWGVDFIGDGPRHPTQIYESLFHAAMAIVLWYLADRDLLRFQRLKFYLIAYCIYRFATESIRPEPIFAAGLTFYQWFTLFFAIGLTLQWNWDRCWILRVEGETR